MDAGDTNSLDTNTGNDAATDTGSDDAGATDTRFDDSGPGEIGTPDTENADTRIADTGSPDTSADTDASVLDAEIGDDVKPDDVAPDAVDLDVAEDTGPPPTPPPGVYNWAPPDAYEVAGIDFLEAVAFHNDGSYFVVLESTDEVHIINWADQSGMRWDLSGAGEVIYWSDLAYDPDLDVFFLVGVSIDSDVYSGLVVQLDNAAYTAYMDGDDSAEEDIFTRQAATRGGMNFVAIAYPWRVEGFPALLAVEDTIGDGYQIEVLGFNPATGQLDYLAATRSTSAFCSEMVWVENLFENPSLLVSCDLNGTESFLYEEVAGEWSWKTSSEMGAPSIGNHGAVAAHPPGDEALVVGRYSGDIIRYAAGRMDEPDSDVNTVVSNAQIVFQQDGQRALIMGRAHGASLDDTVFEYRHPLLDSDELTNVSIPNFATYGGNSNTNLRDGVFRPNCDGGVVVGGRSNISESVGVLAEFQIFGARSCR